MKINENWKETALVIMVGFLIIIGICISGALIVTYIAFISDGFEMIIYLIIGSYTTITVILDIYFLIIIGTKEEVK